MTQDYIIRKNFEILWLQGHALSALPTSKYPLRNLRQSAMAAARANPSRHPPDIVYNPTLVLEDGNKIMPGKRKITGVKPLFGQSRSKAFNTVKRQFKPNLQNKRIYVPELDRWVRVKITAKEIKTIDKIGFMEFLKRRNIPLKQLL